MINEHYVSALESFFTCNGKFKGQNNFTKVNNHSIDIRKEKPVTL